MTDYTDNEINIAIRQLRSVVHFELEGTVFVKYLDQDGSIPPSWEEIIAKIEEDRRAIQAVLSERINNGQSI